jgi:hypothetical protein
VGTVADEVEREVGACVRQDAEGAEEVIDALLRLERRDRDHARGSVLRRTLGGSEDPGVDRVRNHPEACPDPVLFQLAAEVLAHGADEVRARERDPRTPQRALSNAAPSKLARVLAHDEWPARERGHDGGRPRRTVHVCVEQVGGAALAAQPPERGEDAAEVSGGREHGDPGAAIADAERPQPVLELVAEPVQPAHRPVRPVGNKDRDVVVEHRGEGVLADEDPGERARSGGIPRGDHRDAQAPCGHP